MVHHKNVPFLGSTLSLPCTALDYKIVLFVVLVAVVFLEAIEKVNEIVKVRSI